MGDDHPGLCLQLLRSPTGLEGVIDYEPGGYHSVHLGDEFHGQYQYRVIHKLGHGGFATVGLCLVLGEVPRYVALKILVADCSGDYCPELRGLNAIEIAY